MTSCVARSSASSLALVDNEGKLFMPGPRQDRFKQVSNPTVPPVHTASHRLKFKNQIDGVKQDADSLRK
jgi:hypothetical protein